MKEFVRVVKFVLFSISAGLIEIGSFALFNELLHWPYWLSYMIALILSVLWNFTLNRKFTFSEHSRRHAEGGSVLRGFHPAHLLARACVYHAVGLE